jgi:predicted nucleic acid-binding protein
MILDTDALSALADDEPAVVRVYRQAASMELPVIVLGEYRFGIGQSRRRGEYAALCRDSSSTQKGRSPHPLKRSLDRCTLPATPFTTPKSRPTLRCGRRARTRRMVVEMVGQC